MSAQIGALNAQTRDQAGKSVARSLRREGRVPAIIYGGGKDDSKISLNLRELEAEYNKGHFTSKIYNLSAGDETVRVLPVELQIHPVTDVIEHVDFMRIKPGSQVKVKVRVSFSNRDKSPGIKRGGVLNVVRHDVELLCPEDKIPTKLNFDLEGMRIGESLHISNVKLPEGAKPVISDRDFTIATIVGRMKDDAADSAQQTASSEGAEASAEAESTDTATQDSDGK